MVIETQGAAASDRFEPASAVRYYTEAIAQHAARLAVNRDASTIADLVTSRSALMSIHLVAHDAKAARAQASEIVAQLDAWPGTRDRRYPHAVEAAALLVLGDARADRSAETLAQTQPLDAVRYAASVGRRDLVEKLAARADAENPSATAIARLVAAAGAHDWSAARAFARAARAHLEARVSEVSGLALPLAPRGAPTAWPALRDAIAHCTAAHCALAAPLTAFAD